jgi:adenylate cyclase
MDNQTAKPSAEERFAHAKALHSTGATPENTRRIREILEAVHNDPVGLDPRRSAEALSLFAEILLCDYLNRWNDAGAPELDAAENAVERALRIAPDLAKAHYASGLVHRAKGGHQQSLAAFTRSIALNPDMPLAHAQQGAELMYTGRPEEALRPINTALTISRPDSPSRGMFYWYLGRAHFFAGNYYDAIPCLQKSVDMRPNVWYNSLYLVSAYALTGNDKEAKAALSDFDARFPGYTLARVMLNEQTNPNDNEVVIAARGEFHRGLRAAGMPEA